MDLSGQITTTCTARNDYSGQIPNIAYTLSGQITTTISARNDYYGGGPLYISGQITTTTTASNLYTIGPANLTGRIVTAAKAWGGFTAPSGTVLSGRITTISSANSWIITGPLNLTGQISSTSAVTGYFFQGSFNLTGRITSTNRLQTSAFILGQFSGRITSTSSASGSPFVMGSLSGTITSTTTTSSWARFGFPLSGQITSISSASTQFQPTVLLYGTISTSVSTLASWPPFVTLSGQITSTSSVRTDGVFPVIAFVAGTITTTVSAGLWGNFPEFLSGVILSTSSAYAETVLDTYVSGQITTIATAQSIPPQPIINLIGGKITTTVTASFGDQVGAELVPPRPPYPAPFPTQPVEHYLEYITSEHNQKPKYMDTIAISVDTWVQDQLISAGLPGLFDIDYAVGEQLDFVGQWIGKTRWIQVPNAFFSWDEEGLGWNQANWKGPADSDDHLQRLDDYHYRILLFAAIAANHWDGSVPSAYAAWDALFLYSGVTVVIQDYGNMSMMYGVLWATEPDTVLISMLINGHMDLKPEGVKILDYIFQVEPNVAFFGFDAQNDTIAGWEAGSWGILVPPGSGYDPLQPTGITPNE
jgi:hypothetical protein